MNQMKRKMAGAFFGTIMTLAMLIIATSVSGFTAFASNDYVTDHIDAPQNLRFEGSYICWDASQYQYTYGGGVYDYYSNYDTGPNDTVSYTVEVYKVSPNTDPELLKTDNIDNKEATRYDLTDAIEKIQLIDEVGRETGNKLQVRIKAHLTGNEAPSLESGTADITSVPCYVTYMINKDENVYLSGHAFEGWTVAEPEDPTQEGKTFLYWGDAQGNQWDFSRKISADNDFVSHHTLMLDAKWEEIGAHEHDGIVFLPWRSRNSLPNEAGRYYLLNDVDLGGTWNAPQGNTDLCLNGHTVNCSGGREQDPTIKVSGGATLSIFDGTDNKQGKLMMRNGGSAVGVIGGTFILNDAAIDGTDRARTNYGGGVEITGGTFEMRSGKITNCSAGYGGGGVYVEAGGIFRMKGGEISRNRGGSFGGGVYLRGGKIEIIEGTITDNAASENGGGIEFYPVDDDNASISFADESAGEHKINISGNAGGNLYLRNGYKVKINGALSDDSQIGVSLSNPSEYVFTDGLNGNGTIGNFTSDHGGYKIALTEDGEEATFARNPHQITAAAVEHGSLKAYSSGTEITEAIAGEEVRLYPKADTGWSLVRDSFKCTYIDAEGKEITVPVDGYGDFTMPAYDVTVSCEFAEAELEEVRIAALDADGHGMNLDEIEMGQTIQLKLVPYPATADVRSVEWECSDDGSFLTITEDGKIKGEVRDNVDDTKTVTITATATGKNGETATASREVTVKHTHVWENVMGAREATCTAPGNSDSAMICENEFYPCYKADPANVVVTPPLGHDWDAWTSLDGEHHQRVCKRDAEHKDIADHEWDDGVTTTAPTYTAEGVKTYTCRACKATKTEPIPKKTYAPGANPAQKGKDGTPVGTGASEACANKAITSASSDEGPKGTKFAPLRLKSVKQGKNNIVLTWTKNKKAVRYAVYGNYCGKKYKMKRLSKSVKSNSFNVKKISKKLVKGKYYKFIVVALDKNNNVVSTSKVVHVATKGGKVGNHKSVTTKAKKNKVTVKKGKTFKLAGKAVAQSKKLKVKRHRTLKYETSNAKIATVSSKGVIKGKAKGTCYVYAYAQNGVYKKIKVLVK